MASQIKCSKCGSTNFTENHNKNKIVGYASHLPIYAKKFVCNNCGAEWE